MTIYLKKIFYNIFGDKVKVKIFDEENETDLENKVNGFIENVDEIYDIKYCVSSSINGEEQIYCFSALIMYE